MEYEVEQLETFVTWLDKLTDIRAKNRIITRIERAKGGNFGNWSAEGGKVRAMVIDYGPGYRLYYTIRQNTIIILLCGGDKSTQKTDIKAAQKLEEELN
ncbi:MAG: type II toxin-antitoxin system RelE/ParE family toxin [Treponema sp.]|nr:type II toxin-antitoxin system RelE/ParE family toxin [Treponema sp.]MCL2251195.1 type II toxin-antitoxin system RelE/ParE family toxin [Treponema sp.]